jgi:transposase
MIYFIITAIPNDFNITDYFTFRELANIPDEDEVELGFDDPVVYNDAWEKQKERKLSKYVMDKDLLVSIGQSIARSKATSLTSSRQEMFEKAISILEELGLVIYKRIDKNCGIVSTRQSMKTISHMFICVNVLPITSGKNWESTLKKIIELEEYHAPPEILEEMKDTD